MNRPHGALPVTVQVLKKPVCKKWRYRRDELTQMSPDIHIRSGRHFFICFIFSFPKPSPAQSHIPVAQFSINKILYQPAGNWLAHNHQSSNITFFTRLFREDRIHLSISGLSAGYIFFRKSKIHPHWHRVQKTGMYYIMCRRIFFVLPLIPSGSNFILSQGDALVIRYHRLHPTQTSRLF